MSNPKLRQTLWMIGCLGAALLGLSAVATGQEAPQGWIGFRFCHYEPPSEGEAGWIEVSEIAPESPAEEARLEVGDLIVALDGEPLPWADAAAVASFLRGQRPGSELRLTIQRGVERHELEVVVAEPPT